MIGMIGNYKFEMNKTSYQALKESYSFDWNKKERLYNNPIYMKKNKSSHSIEISGTLILQKVYALDPLVAIAEEKTPITFVTLDYARVFRVVILSITIDRDIFLETGSEIRKKFTLKMERFYGN